MKNKLKIGNAQGFWGDCPQAPARLVKQQPDLDYLTLDYLAEVSMSIMAIQREKDPSGGYARDFVDVVRALVPFWENGSKVRIVTNAGGLNPLGCAKACAQLIKESKCPNLKIGVVYGDDVLPLLRADPHLSEYRHMETGEDIASYQERLVTANAYLGAEPIAKLLSSGADIVITGRVADPSLTVGPCIAHFGWGLQDYNPIAGATVAGHIIECGTQVTGGICTNWLHVPGKADIGFPIVEVNADGSFVVTKPKHTGGVVNEETVKEQLLYEIGDPGKYLSPDATVSFLSLALEMDGQDRVGVFGAKGSKPPPTYKVSATYRDGYKTEGLLAIFGPEAVKKGKLCGEIIIKRVRQAGYELERTLVECIGSGDVVGGVVPINRDQLMECMLRISVADHRKEALECFTKEIAPMVTSGPQGVTGYTSGRPNIRQVFGYWPCLIERSQVNPVCELF